MGGMHFAAGIAVRNLRTRFQMASLTRLWAADLRWRMAEWFLNPFFAGASDTASLHCARRKTQGRYPLALTGVICRTRSHVAKKSFNQLLYPRIR